MLKRLLVALTLAFAAVPALASNYGAVQDLPEDEQAKFLDTANELRCPTCTGLSVLESDASFSVQIKDIVKEQVKAGKNKDEILKYFEERYGPWILRSPPSKGFNVLAWALPISMLVLGPLIIWASVWRRRKVISTHGVRSSDEIVKEMEAQLSALRQGVR